MKRSNIKEFLKNFLEKEERGCLLIYGPEGVGKFSLLKEILDDLKDFEKIIIENEEKFLHLSTAHFLVTLSKYKPQTKRIVVIKSAHKFQKEAQNAILKTLEEPLSKTIFILITSKLNKILQTVRSRSILIKFLPFSKEETLEILKERNFSFQDIELALKIYPHQPGKAIEILENKEKIKILRNFFQIPEIEKLKLVEEIKKNFYLSEFLEIYILYEREKIYKERKTRLLKEILNLYSESDYFLNEDLQLTNLILNNG